MLLKRGLEFWLRDARQRTPLHAAAAAQNGADAVAELLQARAVASVQDAEGRKCSLLASVTVCMRHF